VLLSEVFAHRIGLVDDADLEQVLGQPLRVELRGREPGPRFSVALADRAGSGGGGRDEQSALRQLAWKLPQALDRFSLTEDERAALREALREEDSSGPEPAAVAEDFRVVGIFREMTEDERRRGWSQLPANTDLVLPRRTALDLTFRDPARREEGVAQAILYVDDMANVEGVVDRVEALGFGTRSIVEFLERERLTYLLVFGGMTCVAGVALLVSALGIANTMLMSVLERRREIGIMKAVGAGDRQLQALFVLEGALIGLVGGTAGLLLAWALSFPGDAWVRGMVKRDMNLDLTGSIFAFPGWIATTVIAFTAGITIAAALYPAWRASRVDPVTSLRHD
jgi:putative ABC transport system permease protein